MEVRPGYKQTEAGLRPEDWEVAALGGLVRITSGASPSVFRFSGSGIPYFKVEQLSNSEKYLDATDTPYLFERGDTVPGQSVMFAKRGAAIALNKVRILNRASFMDTNLMALTPQNGLECEYLFYALAHIGLWRFADTTSVPQINNKHVKPLPFPLPPLPEQRAIAEALSDVDALLEGLTRLIAKKRDLKQAAMQQLLTGQTRLPGFHGEWESGTLTDLIDALDAGVSVNSVEGDGHADGAFILKTSAVAGGIFLPGERKRIAPRDLARASLSPLRDTIIVSRMNTPDLVGECGYVDRDYPNLFVPDRLWTARLKLDANESARWLSYLLSSTPLKDRIAAAATGTSGSMKNLSKESFLRIPIALPSGDEQNAIAVVLSDMDAELAALEARRDKTRALKQGMMQELLTGRTRLV